MDSPSAVVYAGSFDPPTLGHIDVVRRASAVFGEVIVLVAENMAKQGLFSVAERVELLQQELRDLKNVQVDTCQGLVVDYCKKKGIRTLIRGIRSVSDYEYEASMGRLNADLYSKIETLFFISRKDYVHLKSEVVKEIARFGGDLSKMLPARVEKKLKQKIS